MVIRLKLELKRFLEITAAQILFFHGSETQVRLPYYNRELHF